MSQQQQQEAKVTEKLIILYETSLSSAEKTCIYSVCGVDNVLELDSKMKTQSIGDILSSYTCVLIDMRETDLMSYYEENRKYIYDHSDVVKCVYKKKSGDKIEDSEKKTIKQSFNCVSVRKYLPEYAKTFAEYLSKAIIDHVSHNVVKLTKLEKLIQLFKSCFGQ